MAEDNPTITTTDPALAAPTATTTAENTDINIDIPPLTTYQATSQDDFVSALRLIADSVAQQRQDASQAVISHPAVLAATTAVLAIVFRILYHGQAGDLAVVATTMAGCVMAGLAGVGYVTSGYLELAERTGTWAWLCPENPIPTTTTEGEGGQDKPVVLVTKYGEEIIGTVVVHLTSNSTSTSTSTSPSPSTSISKSKSKSNPKSRHRELPKTRTTRTTRTTGTTGTIRAWTVKRRYRNKGIGTGLLEEAVTLCQKNDWEGPVFDQNHANSVRLLPGIFLKGRFEKREVKARGVLEGVKRRCS